MIGNGFREQIGNFFSGRWESSKADSEILSEIEEYAVNSGGKRVRPILVMLSASTCEGSLDKAKIVGEAIEIYHNFTLIHDDIEDGDNTRRGNPAVWKKFGTPHAINGGDSLHSRAYRKIISNSEDLGQKKTMKLLEILSEADKEVIEGQTHDISFRENSNVDEDQYLEMVRKKTGSLLKAACICGAIIGEAKKEDREKLSRFGSNIGPAFQIKDDVIDLEGQKGREKIGNDVREGKKSLIAIKALERLGSNETEELRDILNKPRPKTNENDVDRAFSLFRSVNSISYADKKAREMADQAINELSAIDKNTEEIEEFAEFLVERKF